jgi:hypothetical protein
MHWKPQSVGMPDSAVQEGDVMAGHKKDRYGWDSESVELMYYRYKYLLNKGHQVEWKSFDEFLLWCKGTWDPGMTLRRIDEELPYGPSNCIWVPMSGSEDYRKRMASKWDSIMAPIRRRYQQEIQEAKNRKREYFQYEHPDLVREGIVWQ